MNPETNAGQNNLMVCNQCRHQYLSDPSGKPGRCPNCWSVDIELGQAETRVITPELVVPFVLQRSTLTGQLEKFTSGIPFPPVDLTAGNLIKRLQKVYFPAWLVDVDVSAGWMAEVGFNYQVVSHQDKYEEGRGGWSSQQVKEGRVRWEPRQGNLERSYTNLSAPAVDGDKFYAAGKRGESPEGDRAFTVEDLEGCLLQLPDRDPVDAWSEALPAAQLRAADECRAACGADHIRQFEWSPEFSNQNWTLFLTPTYRTYYLDDDQRPQSIQIHGKSGQTIGVRRASMKRAQRVSLTVLIVAAVIFLAGIFLAAIGILVPPVLVIGAGVMMVSILVAVGAVIPPGVVWQFNRSNTQAAGNRST